MSVKVLLIGILIIVLLAVGLFVAVKVATARQKKIKEMQMMQKVIDKNREILNKYINKENEVNEWKDKAKSKDYKDAIRDVVSRNNSKLQNNTN